MDYGAIILNFFVQVVFPVFGAIILVFVSYLIKKIANKYDMEWLLNHQDMSRDMATGAISYVEELVASRIKEGYTYKITGKEKLDMAIIWMMEQMPEIKREEAQAWIESMLGRIEGVGATGERVIE